MRIGAVIVTYHTVRADLERCLTSLAENDVTECTIVDNGHSDARGTGRLRPVIIRQPTNRGFAAAANRGAAATSSEVLLFLNPDAALEPNALKFARRSLVDFPAAVVAGCALYSLAGIPEDRSYGALPSPSQLFFRHLYRPPRPAETTPVGWVSGGAMLVRTDAFRRLQGFDEQFFLYWEDVDLCRRARRAGGQVVYVPHARVIHRRGVSLPNHRFRTRLYDQSADKYFRKHYAIPTWLSLRLARYWYRRVRPRAV